MSATTDNTPSAPRQRILVVDDEVYIRELLTEYFSRLGYTVVAVDSGERAVRAVDDASFGVALVDLKMPGMDGIATLKEIRKQLPVCTIIIMTGYPTIDSSIEALRAGAYDYLIKPFKLSELRGAIDRALREYCMRLEIDRIQNNLDSVEDKLRDYRLSAPEDHADNPPAASAQPDRYLDAQLRELGELRDAGYISPQEYDERRANLLSGGSSQ